MRPRPLIQALLLCSFVSFSAVADDDDDDSGVPGFIKGPILHQIYDGITDDLLTAGLGKTGLMGAAPDFVDPAKPTAGFMVRSALRETGGSSKPVPLPIPTKAPAWEFMTCRTTPSI